MSILRLVQSGAGMEHGTDHNGVSMGHGAGTWHWQPC
jgi:hypothetical protein